MDKITKTNCATCASPVLINKSDEWTCFYTPLYREDDVRDLVLAARSMNDCIIWLAMALREQSFGNPDPLSTWNSQETVRRINPLESALSKFPIDNETSPEVKSV